jgi:hypothetical protein
MFTAYPLPRSTPERFPFLLFAPKGKKDFPIGIASEYPANPSLFPCFFQTLLLTRESLVSFLGRATDLSLPAPCIPSSGFVALRVI